MSKDGGPAFPIPIAGCTDGGVYNVFEQSAGTLGGMSLRDYFAAKALQGMLAYSHVNPLNGNYHENCSSEDCAMQAYEYADAMLKARES